ncbi:putative short chain dehydrogenase/ reductase [Patellaria atrata CBS 101060]|uniref:Short chain dehydrogenase/ reductase n=1 Tax=Patellaria atrata CBS 101060 TaxID=1346257 RepID=A0A9P4S7P6_9PEZI|nr:putative short chain dehydrogenase/ reductase [Patellaria atrata CBS 101060]
MSQKLSGKVALVTGASKGIGRATALALAADGATVAVNYLSSASSASDVVSQIGTDRATAIRADVSTPEGQKSLVAETVQKYGKIDILVLNAGSLLQNGGIDDIDEETFDRLFAVNVRGPLFMAKAAIPYIPAGGRIMFFSTSLTKVSGITPNYLLYAATKGAVEQMASVLAKTLASKNVTVNTICPGPIGTDAFFVGKTEQMVKGVAGMNPFGRIGTPEEIAGVVKFVASEESSWMTGQCFRINGGMTVG